MCKITALKYTDKRVSVVGKITGKEKRKAVHKHEKQIKWTLNRLWEEYKANKTGLKGLKTDENRFKLHIEPVLGKKEPAIFSPFDIDRIRVSLLKTHKPQTVVHVVTLIKRIINFGVAKQLCPGLHFKIEMPKVDNRKTEDLSTDQLRSLMQALGEEPNIEAANFVRLALFTGMRRGELFRLKWSDIDFILLPFAIRKAGRGKQYRLTTMPGQFLKTSLILKVSFFSPAGMAVSERISRNLFSVSRSVPDSPRISVLSMAFGMCLRQCLLLPARLICIPFKSFSHTRVRS